MSEEPSRPGWRPASPTQPNEPVLFFSPEPEGNVPGGMIWISGGRRIDTGGWRGDGRFSEPTLYIPLREIAPSLAQTQTARPAPE